MSTNKVLKKRYWDSCVFLGYLKDEYDRRSQCSPIIEAAKSKKTKLITSALTLAEVFWIGGKVVPGIEARKKIKDFFEYSFIDISDLTRRVAEHARELKWDHESISQWDAVHLSTVINSDIVLLETYDSVLLRYDLRFKNQNGKKIKIAKPFISHQGELYD